MAITSVYICPNLIKVFYYKEEYNQVNVQKLRKIYQC